MVGYLFATAALACVLLAVWKGGWEERTVAVALFVGIWTTRAIYNAYDRDFIAAHGALAINEAAILAIYLFVAFRSKRFWPLFVTGLQVPALLALMTPMFGDTILSYGLGVAQGVWAYLQLAVLVLATLRRRPARATTSSPGSSPG